MYEANSRSFCFKWNEFNVSFFSIGFKKMITIEAMINWKDVAFPPPWLCSLNALTMSCLCSWWSCVSKMASATRFRVWLLYPFWTRVHEFAGLLDLNDDVSRWNIGWRKGARVMNDKIPILEQWMGCRTWPLCQHVWTTSPYSVFRKPCNEMQWKNALFSAIQETRCPLLYDLHPLRNLVLNECIHL